MFDAQMTMKDARTKEKEFFLSKPEYADLGNVGTTYLAEKLSAHLINEIMKSLPSITSYIDQRWGLGQYMAPRISSLCNFLLWMDRSRFCSISKLEKDLKALGGDIKDGRGSMLHLILTLCRKLEEAFAKIVDGGRDGEILLV